MKVIDYLKIAKYINDCPNCGNDKVGENEGAISVLESVITRTCKCGFHFKYDVDAGIEPRQVKQAIDEALSECE